MHRLTTLRLAALALAASFLTPAPAQTTATWTGTNSNYSDPANWSPGTVPLGPNGTAIFGNSGVTDLSFVDGIAFGTLSFSSNAQAFTFGNGDSASMDFYGAGIVNHGTATQTFVTGWLNFHNTSSAGAATISNQGLLNFYDSSTAGAASITNTNTELHFFNSASAGSATITNAGILEFHDSSTAGSATITNTSIGTTNRFLRFYDASTAGAATIINEPLGLIDLARHNSGDFSIGALSGSGTVTFGDHDINLGVGLGTISLIVGAINTSTTFSGKISGDGSLTKVGTGTLTLSGASTYTGYSFAASTVVRSGTLAITGSLTQTAGLLVVGDQSGDAGTLILSAGSAVSAPGFTLGNRAGSTGTFTMNGGTMTGSTGSYLSVGGDGNGTFTLNDGALSTAGGYIGTGFTSTGTATVNGGTWTMHSIPLFVGGEGTGTLAITNGAVSSAGGIIAQSDISHGTVNVSGGSWSNSDGLYVGWSGAGSLTVSGTGAVSSLFATIGTYETSHGTVTVNGGTWTNTGTVSLGERAGAVGTLNLLGGVVTAAQVSEGDGSGTVTFNGGTLRLNGHQGALFNGFETGDVILTGPGGGTIDTQAFNVATAVVLSGTGALTKTGTGTLTLSGANTYAGGTTVSAGTLLANNTTGSAFGPGAVTVNSGATLGGSGFIGGLTTVASGAHLAPGNSPGTLTFTNGLTLNNGAILDFEIGGLSRGTQHDALDITGTLTFGGTLQVALINGFTPASGNSFDLLNYTTASGTFSQLNLPTLTSGLSWNTSALYTTGVLSVNAAAIPEPSTYATIFGGLALGLVMLRRRKL